MAASLPTASRQEEAEIARLLREPLTAAAAVRLALLQHRGVRAALIALGIPRGQLLTAGCRPIPRSRSACVPYNRRSAAGRDRRDYEISALILLPLRRSAGAQRAVAGRAAAAASTILSIAYVARQAFYDAAAALSSRPAAACAAGGRGGHAVRAELARVGNIPTLDSAARAGRAGVGATRCDGSRAERSARSAGAQRGLRGWSARRPAGRWRQLPWPRQPTEPTEPTEPMQRTSSA